ncbi:MAG: MarC family protein [Bacteroidetes bacterium]|jgi:multiple antibiotic resistance protein|nr:MarC family protein [Bacteroidota bacterium]MBT3748136.1 MarC family protein [Bacteroidota bacterium]MBT4398713.1 MarC family protein [Bacteroidota bacterium]MBT5426678.1 MarC family protein [Bacteroidota bacterium]MBT7093201.1 MarC family protein [Bacteroidota bacterium]
MKLNFLDIVSAFMVLFAVIDILGSIPIILSIKNKGGQIKALQASLVAFALLVAFLFLGEQILGLFGVDISSFAIAGSFIILFLALEMVLGIEFFKGDTPSSASIVPIAFPLVAGAGSITTLISLRAEYASINILIALFLNIVVVFLVLKLTHWFEKLLGQAGILILKKFFGIILLAIAIKLFMTNTGIEIK